MSKKISSQVKGFLSVNLKKHMDDYKKDVEMLDKF